MSNKKLAVIGLGYVGLPLALLAVKKGYHVVGIDLNHAKVNSINHGESPFTDEKISEDLKNHKIYATTDFRELNDIKIMVICVPTPVYEDYMPNLEPVERAASTLGKFLKKGDLVILESTVNPGVTETFVLPILEKASGLKGGVDFHLSHCPERINPGDSNWDVENIPRVVGSLDEKGLLKTVKFYRNLINGEVRPMTSLKEAEAVKVVENTFRDVNIAFVNELAMSFSKLDIDVVNVIQGASTKPFAFLPHFPGCGVGGHCIPVDPYYLIEYAKQKGFQHNFLALARRINNQMPMFTVQRLIAGLEEEKINILNSNIAVLGLAYKADIGDYRESPALKMIEFLDGFGAIVRTYDPYVLDKSTHKNLEDVLTGVQAVIIATAHSEFKAITPEYIKTKGIKVLVDGRNALDKGNFVEVGINYKGIGR